MHQSSDIETKNYDSKRRKLSFWTVKLNDEFKVSRVLASLHVIKKVLWKILKCIRARVIQNAQKRKNTSIWYISGKVLECISSSNLTLFMSTMYLQIIFVENKKLRSTLLIDIEESQLPDTYGGQLPLVPIQGA